MARNPGPKGPTPVESITHADKRKNIPTADAQEFVTPQVEQLAKVTMQRDASLDPQLIWRGKYPDDDPAQATDLVADAPPIYIQEKVDPRVLIENLRRTAKEGEPEPELTLFEAFDGLDELDAVDFYAHDANWSNRMILGDSLQVMTSLAEREDLRGKVQMVYIDPPYGIKFKSNWQVSARKPNSEDGKLSDAVREAEQIKAFRDTWELGIHSYLSYLRDRLHAARDLLTESGSCFVQIGDENVHLVRAMMDEVFGRENFVSQISVDKTSSSSMSFIDSVADYLLWFAKDAEHAKYHDLLILKNEKTLRFLELRDGQRRPATKDERDGIVAPPEGSRWFEVGDLTSQTDSSRSRYTARFEGKEFPVGKRNWATPPEGLAKAIAARRIAPRAQSIGFVRFSDDIPATPLRNNWTDTGTGSFTDDKIYVVQTGTKILQRCILMTTDPGDLVVDPTCGSGTSAVMAEQWGRRWITIDTSRVALALARQRLMAAKFPYYYLRDSTDGRLQESRVEGKALASGPAGGDIRSGFVYERVQHITLKSIANNPDIVEGMTRSEIDAAIKRHAEYEYLYDKPYEDKSKVRVSGPFTVESLSPHRSLSFGDEPVPATASPAATAAEGASFEQTILENLRKAGVQNGKTNQRISFASLEPYAGTYIQAVGERLGGTDIDSAEGPRPLRVGIAIGPQYGTISPSFVKAAALEAIRADDIDLLCILGFAFDPQATQVADDAVQQGFSIEGERQMGKVHVLFVRMNSDLLMGEDLKKTGAGNLFTVFGEPDIELRETDDGQFEVELRGVDVYDPSTGEIRSNDTSQIALWMIDTDYNEESFFVRHCYFTGGNDPYKRLKTALKAEINEDAWATLYSTVSRAFPAPTSGKIAVKVINDYGDEVLKVIEI